MQKRSRAYSQSGHRGDIPPRRPSGAAVSRPRGRFLGGARAHAWKIVSDNGGRPDTVQYRPQRRNVATSGYGGLAPPPSSRHLRPRRTRESVENAGKRKREREREMRSAALQDRHVVGRRGSTLLRIATVIARPRPEV